MLTHLLRLQRGVMITFNVIKEQYGWAIRTASGMTTPFRTRDAALREAECLANSIRGHGQCVEIIVEHMSSGEPRDQCKRLSLTVADIILQRRAVGAP
jgi:hypothetical protein